MLCYDLCKAKSVSLFSPSLSLIYKSDDSLFHLNIFHCLSLPSHETLALHHNESLQSQAASLLLINRTCTSPNKAASALLLSRACTSLHSTKLQQPCYQKGLAPDIVPQQIKHMEMNFNIFYNLKTPREGCNKK